MDFSTDLKALIRSHQATDHFDRAEQIAFDPNASAFSSSNAWWLAELSRWMYVGKRMPADKRHRPQSILLSVGLTEQAYWHVQGVHAALVSGTSESGARFNVLVFRGTSQFRNWVTHANLGPLRNNAHRGYENVLDAIWPELEPTLATIDGKLFFTGHSMGGALAALAARRLQPSAVYTFGSPPIGNYKLAEEYASNFNHCPVYRLLNYRDIVSRAPLARCHVGELHYLRHDHVLHNAPDLRQVVEDQRRGPRPVMRKLNKKKLIHLPERLSDHSPQNYVASLERVSLGNDVSRVTTESASPELEVSQAQLQ